MIAAQCDHQFLNQGLAWLPVSLHSTCLPKPFQYILVDLPFLLHVLFQVRNVLYIEVFLSATRVSPCSHSCVMQDFLLHYWRFGTWCTIYWWDMWDIISVLHVSYQLILIMFLFLSENTMTVFFGFWMQRSVPLIIVT